MRSLVNIRGPQRGFTLVELLVVIAIITILAALMIPIVNSVREKGNMVECANNLRSIGQAIMMWSNDNDYVLPAVQDAQGGIWDTNILEYLSNDESVFECPSDPYVLRESTNAPRSYAVNGGFKYEAAFRYPFGEYQEGVAGADLPMTPDQIVSSGGRLILVGERPGNSRTDRGYLGSFAFCGLDQIAGTVHKKGAGANYLFADMAVQYFPKADIEPSAAPGSKDYWYVE